MVATLVALTTHFEQKGYENDKGRTTIGISVEIGGTAGS